MQSIALIHVSMPDLNLNHKILDISIICLICLNLVNGFVNLFLSKHKFDESFFFVIEITYFKLKMMGSSKSNWVRWSKNCRSAQALKKMFLTQKIDPDHYSGERIYESRGLFQQFEFNIFSKNLRDMTETIKSARGIDNFSEESK